VLVIARPSSADATWTELESALQAMLVRSSATGKAGAQA
jgi:hypothetical protein